MNSICLKSIASLTVHTTSEAPASNLVALHHLPHLYPPNYHLTSKQTNKISVRTKTNRNKICFGCVSVCFVKPKNKNFGLFRCFKHILKQLKQQTETNRNNPKFLEKYQNMLSINLFRLVFCLFWFNQN